MTTFTSQAEARQAIMEFFVSRNAARGQYPKRITVKPDLFKVEPDGTSVYIWIYKTEIVYERWGCYETTVKF